MKQQNFIPNKGDIFDSDDSMSFEGGVEFDSEDSEVMQILNSNENNADIDSSTSDLDSNDETSDLNAKEGDEGKTTKEDDDISNASDSSSVDFSSDDDDSDDSDVVEATMEDIFGIEPNQEAKRNHPPNFRTNVAVLDLCFHPEEDLLAAGFMDGDCVIYEYSMEEVKEVKRFSHHETSCRQVCFNGDGDLLYTISKDKSLALVDIESSTIKTHIKDAHDSSIFSFIEINDNLCATGDDDGVVKLWDVRKSKEICEISCGEQTVTSFLADEKGKFLSATVADGSLSAIDIRKREIYTQSEMYSSEFNCQSFVRGEEKVAVGSGSGMIYIFNWGEFGYHINMAAGHTDVVQCVVPLTDHVIITGCDDGNIRALYLFDHKFIGVVGQHKGFGVENLALSNDGNLLASCSLDEEIQFWDIGYLYKENIGRKRNRVSGKAGTLRNLPSSRKRNKLEFFKDFPAKLESDEDERGPVAGPSYESD